MIVGSLCAMPKGENEFIYFSFRRRYLRSAVVSITSLLMCSIFAPKMYPTKSTYDYMTEMNRLFPRTTENDVYQPLGTMPSASLYSPFRQSTPVNRSSSSNDSTTSPDSFPDLSHHLDNDRRAYESPFIVRRQRPIIGRKIFDNVEHLPPVDSTPKRVEHDFGLRNPILQQDEQILFPQTPPNIQVEPKNYTQNIFYELFPAEKKGFEFKQPVTVSPVSNYTPTSPNFSPTFSSVSPNSAKIPRMPTSPFRFPNRLNFGASSSRQQEMKPSKMCTFCRKNGETPLVYTTHCVRENIGSKNIVTCPILRSHVCSTCGASGDNAHTITYCPVLRSNNNGRPLQSTTITLKNTRIKSNGRRRF